MMLPTNTITHDLADCERTLKALPTYNVFRGTPAVFNCDCGNRFVYEDDEANGASWFLVGKAQRAS
jgi:hypothetical protein